MTATIDFNWLDLGKIPSGPSTNVGTLLFPPPLTLLPTALIPLLPLQL